jgi:multidrug/hemolysin transport system ATP-binding protein
MIIEVSNLTKNFGSVAAVNGVSFGVEKGQLFSFLGTTGAGKSTTIHILTTLLNKTSGKVSVAGFDVDKNADAIKKHIGVVFQASVLDEPLTVMENLRVRASLYDDIKDTKAAAQRAIKLCGIDFAGQRYKTLSGGMKRRADIARALVHTPEILFLDEPTTGLDPKTRRDIWQLIRNLQVQHGTTVFLTTHYMEEAAESDNIVIINKGQVVAEGTPAQLKERLCSDQLKIVFKNGEKLTKQLKKTTDAFGFLEQHKDEIEIVEILQGTLDDAFLNLTNEGGQTNAD